MSELEFRAQVESVAGEAGALRVAVAYHDYQTDEGYAFHGEEWFHAASTIKVPVLVAVFGAIEDGRLAADSPVHVRNRFLSAADGAAYRIDPARDADAHVHARVGRTMGVTELAHHMIVTSSNLATNLLVDLLGVSGMNRTLAQLGVAGVELARGVEDERAYQQGVVNRVTAGGLVRVLRLIEEEQAISTAASEGMLEILHQQEFRGGIPAGLPDDARVANKTGEISSVAHDAGIVYLPDRKPYVLAILTEWEPSATSGRRDTLARISRLVYERLAAGVE